MYTTILLYFVNILYVHAIALRRKLLSYRLVNTGPSYSLFLDASETRLLENLSRRPRSRIVIGGMYNIIFFDSPTYSPNLFHLSTRLELCPHIRNMNRRKPNNLFTTVLRAIRFATTTDQVIEIEIKTWF